MRKSEGGKESFFFYFFILGFFVSNTGFRSGSICNYVDTVSLYWKLEVGWVDKSVGYLGED